MMLLAAIMRPVKLTVDQLPPPRRVLGFEGGSVSLTEKEGRFYVIVNESTMAFLLDEEDLRGVKLVNIIEFDSDAERVEYLNQRFPGATFDAEENDKS